MIDVCMLCFRRREIIAPLPNHDSLRLSVMTAGLYHIISFLLRRTFAKPYCAECQTPYSADYRYSEFFELEFNDNEWGEVHGRQKFSDIAELIGLPSLTTGGSAFNEKSEWSFESPYNEMELPRHQITSDIVEKGEYPIFEQGEIVFFVSDISTGYGMSERERVSRFFRKLLSLPRLSARDYGRPSYQRAVLTDKHLILIVRETNGYKGAYSANFVYRLNYDDINSLVSDGEFLKIYRSSHYHPVLKIRTGRNTGRLLAQLYGLIDVGLIKKTVKIYDRPNYWEFNTKWRELPPVFEG